MKSDFIPVILQLPLYRSEVIHTAYIYTFFPTNIKIPSFVKSNIQGVTGGTDQTSGGCSLGQTLPI